MKLLLVCANLGVLWSPKDLFGNHSWGRLYAIFSLFILYFRHARALLGPSKLLAVCL